jgi:hypothetical protein
MDVTAQPKRVPASLEPAFASSFVLNVTPNCAKAAAGKVCAGSCGIYLAHSVVDTALCGNVGMRDQRRKVSYP